MSDKIQKRIAFGYDRSEYNRIVINPSQSMAVKLLYACYADGESMGAISSRFQACGIPSPYNHAKWGRQAIANILSYERYTGDSDYPAIIDRDLFDRVQAIRQSRAK
jgi:site-specific DNA recombinase